MNDVKIISLKDKIVKLIIEKDQGEINVEDLLRIDYANILGEILTFPVILNRLGILLSDIEDHLRKSNFILDKEKVDLKRKRAIAEMKAQNELKKTITKPTKQQIENQVRLDEEHQIDEDAYRAKKLELLDTQHDRDIVNSLYWSAKSKDEKLNKISDKIRPSEFEGDILDGSINGVLIKVSEKLIKG